MRTTSGWRRARSVAATFVALAVAHLPGVLADTSPPPAAAPTSFTFGAAGDFGSTSAMGATLEALSGAGTDFFLGLGDLSYNPPGTEQTWCNAVTAVVGPAYPFEIVSG
ncbi:MAG TPA: hypothetical protein VGO87_13595, partial [Acidimicrobiia bacterium]